MTSALRVLTILAALVLCGCATQPQPQPQPPDERLRSTLWVQTSAEYRVVTRQVYVTASGGLEAALADPAWNAVTSARSQDSLPPAIIIDVDETVLDNSGHTARAILARRDFRSDTWGAWVQEASAPPIPGAVDYLRRADELGIVVIYLTNRYVDKEPATRANLAAVGAPLRDDIDTILTREEQAGWGRDKKTRRDWVSARYRVLHVLGDDLGDFVSLPADITAAERVAVAEQFEVQWGRYWFMIPNPIYGGWEKALSRGGESLFSLPMERKVEYLDPRWP